MEALGIHTEHIDIVLTIGVPVLPLHMLEGLEQMFNRLLIGIDLEIIALRFCQHHPAEFFMHRDIPVVQTCHRIRVHRKVLYVILDVMNLIIIIGHLLIIIIVTVLVIVVIIAIIAIIAIVVITVLVIIVVITIIIVAIIVIIVAFVIILFIFEIILACLTLTGRHCIF